MSAARARSAWNAIARLGVRRDWTYLCLNCGEEGLTTESWVHTLQTSPRDVSCPGCGRDHEIVAEPCP